MNRDHLLGYPPAGIVSGDCPTDYDDMSVFDHVPFGLGRPQRLYIEQRNRLDAIGRKKQPLRDFEQLPHPNPDGSYTAVRPGSLFGKEAAGYVVDEIRGDGPVLQASDYTYSEEAGQVEIVDWRSLPARQAIPLSALVPPGAMVMRKMGLQTFFVDGREVTEAEYDAHMSKVGVKECMRFHADGSISAPQRPVPADMLASALRRMETDPSYRNRMAQRITAINADLAQQGPTKRDGGITLAEGFGSQVPRPSTMSIPFRCHTFSKVYDEGFDFPPNA